MNPQSNSTSTPADDAVSNSAGLYSRSELELALQERQEDEYMSSEEEDGNVDPLHESDWSDGSGDGDLENSANLGFSVDDSYDIDDNASVLGPRPYDLDMARVSEVLPAVVEQMRGMILPRLVPEILKQMSVLTLREDELPAFRQYIRDFPSPRGGFACSRFDLK